MRPTLRLAPSRVEPKIHYYEPSDRVNEIMREQLDEMFSRMQDLVHVSHCGCDICAKYEILVNMLLLPVFG